MKRARIFTWLLIVAMLTVVCPAFGEEPAIDLTDGAAEEELTIDSTDDGLSDDGLIDIGAEDGLDIELPEIELEEDLSSAADAVADGEAGLTRKASHNAGGGADNDKLFAGYVDMLFGKGVQKNGYVGDGLAGLSKQIYDYLLPLIQQVASGTLSETVFFLPTDMVLVTSDAQWKEMRAISYKVLDALLADCPFHLFWYDKTKGLFGCEEGVMYYAFTVADEFAVDDFTTDASKIQSAQIAVTNAKGVVKKYAGVSDYKKLCGYRDYICNANTYNDDAASDESWPYGNPWQLIWVFDGDSSTNVVCEGYSKAFQYLCDLSSFSSAIQCHIVTGKGGSASSQGDHMWNVVTMGDGKNYHTDITFVDSGLPEAFLAGAVPIGYNEYYCVADQAYYQFDSETLNTYPASTLNLSTTDYNPGNPDQPTADPTKVTLNKTKATVVAGAKLALQARLSPSGATTSLTWTSSNKKVATVDGSGVVKALKKGTAIITVKTANGKTATCKITVPTAPAKVKFAKKSYSVKAGKTVKLSAKLTPAKAKTTLTWSSSNTSIATVSSKGVVKGIRKGTVTITVTTANGKWARVKVTVK